MTVAAAENQTTPVVTGVDIFSFGPADHAPDPGTKESEQATPAPAKEDHPGEATKEEGGSQKAEGESEAHPEDAKGKPRFKDHAAAEEGYRNLQGMTTKAQQELADAKQRLAEYEAQQAAQREQQTATERQVVIDQAIDEFEFARNKQALQEINKLDPDDPEHEDKVARIWAACHKDVRKFAAQPVDKDGKPIAAEVRKAEGGSEAVSGKAEGGSEAAAGDARSARPSPTGGAKTAEEVRAYIDTKVRAAEIDPDDELWVGVALTTPEKGQDGKRMSVDQQIEWTINRYNERKAAIMAAARQSAGLPLGEGGSGPRAPAPGAESGAGAAGPISLGDAIARSNERRRL